MIRACRCLSRLTCRKRTIGCLRDSEEGPGARGAGAASRSDMLQCRGSRRRERQRNRLYNASVACASTLQSFLSNNNRGGLPSLAAARA